MSRERMNEGTFELDKKKLEQIVQKYVKAVNNGDYEEWINLWVENAIRLPPHAPMIVGKKEIGDSIKLTMNENDLELKVLKIVEIKVYGNIASTICEYSLSRKRSEHYQPDRSQNFRLQTNGNPDRSYRRSTDLWR